MTGIKEKTILVRPGLEALIARENGKVRYAGDHPVSSQLLCGKLSL
jgi:hypothetical protein